MTDPQNQQELDLRSYLRPVWRRKWIVLLIVAAAAAATYFIASSQQKTYVTSTDLYVQVADPAQSVSSTGAASTPTSQSIADVARLITAQAVTSSVDRSLGVSPTMAANSVSATPATNSDFVTVTASSHSPTLAAALANTYVSEFLRSRTQSVVDEARRDLAAAQAALRALRKGAASLSQRLTLTQEIQTFQQIQLNPSAGARQIDRAAVPGFPSSPRPTRDAIFAGTVGLILAVIIAFCLELLDRRLVRVSTVESMYGRPVLAVLPHVSDPTPRAEHERAVVPVQFREELRSLRVMLRLRSEKYPHSIIVTSALPREGKSTITRDLALVYAESGERVLVIDTDLRRPSMNQMFGLKAEKGLAHVLRGELALAEAAQHGVGPEPTAHASVNGDEPAPANGGGSASAHGVPGSGGSLDVLAHGELVDDPVVLLSSERMMALLEEAEEAYDVVLLDTPPVLTVADGVPLLELVDCVLVVARLGQTTRHIADRLNDLIEHRLSGVNFAGVIANDRRKKFDDEGYGSYGRHGYGYYQSKPDEREQKTPAEA